MRIEIKLYSYHDMDLVGLYKTGQVVFPETTKQVLDAYAKKEVFRVRLQKVNYKRLAKYPDDSYRKYYHYYVTLDEHKDAAAITLLNSITPGCRNSFIKVVLRQYLCGVLLSAYSTDGNTRLFRDMASLFQGNREYRDVQEEKQKKQERKKGPKENSRQTIKEHAEHQKAVPTRKAAEHTTETFANESPNAQRPTESGSLQQPAQAAKEKQKEKAQKERNRVALGQKEETSSLQAEPELREEPRMQAVQELPTTSEGQPISNPQTAAEDTFDDFDDFLSQTTEQY